MIKATDIIFCARFYGQDIRASAILFGDVPRLTQSEELHEILDSFTEQYENEEQKNNARKAAREQRKVCTHLFPYWLSVAKSFHLQLDLILILLCRWHSH